MSYFYEIRSADNAVLKRTGGFPDREAATEAGWRILHDPGEGCGLSICSTSTDDL